jgi:hypothetical protein
MIMGPRRRPGTIRRFLLDSLGILTLVGIAYGITLCLYGGGIG